MSVNLLIAIAGITDAAFLLFSIMLAQACKSIMNEETITSENDYQYLSLIERINNKLFNYAYYLLIIIGFIKNLTFFF